MITKNLKKAATKVNRARLKKHLNAKKRYTPFEKKEVKKELGELKAGKLTMNLHGGKKITSRKQAVAKGLNIADSREKSGGVKIKYKSLKSSERRGK